MRDVAEPAAQSVESLGAEEVLAHAVERFHPQIALACSFQKETTVLLDMLAALESRPRVFTIDTGVLFEETYDTWRRLEERYGIEIEVFHARTESWTSDRCCADDKTAALRRAVEGLDAWITGVRREQAPTRANAAKIGWDDRHGLWKVNPLADWAEKDVWRYILERDLPYNALHDQGYASIGCVPCTRPGAGREGRWPGQDRVECGIHGDG